MKDFLYSIVIAFSFFTIIPLPVMEWTKGRMRFLPLLMPFVGFGIGAAGYALYLFLMGMAVSEFCSAVIMALFYLVITGGLHMDGMMDTADAYFSRRSKERKLEIMKDSQVGAFAVMAFVSLFLVKIAFFYEIFWAGKETAVLLLVIPALSRTVQGFILCRFPYAKEDGLAVIFSGAAEGRTPSFLIICFVLMGGLIYFLTGMRGLLLPFGLLLFTLFYYYSAKKNFGGVTGDIVGAFVELAEVLMLALLLVI